MNRIMLSILSGLTIALLMILVAGPAVEQASSIEEMIILNYKAILITGTIISFPIYRLN